MFQLELKELNLKKVLSRNKLLYSVKKHLLSGFFCKCTAATYLLPLLLLKTKLITDPQVIR